MGKCPTCKQPLKKNNRKKASGSRKGTPFEREICKEVSLWWSWGERDDLVWRTATSGGRATSRFETKNAMTQYGFGDLAPTHESIYPLFDYFLFEVKRGYNSTLDLMEEVDLPGHLKKVPQVQEWQTTARRDAIRAGRPETIIIGRRDNRKSYCIISHDLFVAVCDLNCGDFGDPHVRICTKEIDVVMCLLTDWFSFMEPDHVRLCPV